MNVFINFKANQGQNKITDALRYLYLANNPENTNKYPDNNMRNGFFTMNQARSHEQKHKNYEIFLFDKAIPHFLKLNKIKKISYQISQI